MSDKLTTRQLRVPTQQEANDLWTAVANLPMFERDAVRDQVFSRMFGYFEGRTDEYRETFEEAQIHFFEEVRRAIGQEPFEVKP